MSRKENGQVRMGGGDVREVEVYKEREERWKGDRKRKKK